VHVSGGGFMIEMRDSNRHIQYIKNEINIYYLPRILVVFAYN